MVCILRRYPVGHARFTHVDGGGGSFAIGIVVGTIYHKHPSRSIRWWWFGHIPTDTAIYNTSQCSADWTDGSYGKCRRYRDCCMGTSYFRLRNPYALPPSIPGSILLPALAMKRPDNNTSPGAQISKSHISATPRSAVRALSRIRFPIWCSSGWSIMGAMLCGAILKGPPPPSSRPPRRDGARRFSELRAEWLGGVH